MNETLRTISGTENEIKRSPRGRMSDGEPNPIDIHVGKRIKLRREILGMSQEKLAAKLGLTFQQVQKYERATNRVGASRLWDISQSLDVPIDFFFENMDHSTIKQSPRMVTTATTPEIFQEKKMPSGTDPMTTAETLELVRAYYRIPSRKTARQLLKLADALSKTNLNGTDENEEN